MRSSFFSRVSFCFVFSIRLFRFSFVFCFTSSPSTSALFLSAFSPTGRTFSRYESYNILMTGWCQKNFTLFTPKKHPDTNKREYNYQSSHPRAPSQETAQLYLLFFFDCFLNKIKDYFLINIARLACFVF